MDSTTTARPGADDARHARPGWVVRQRNRWLSEQWRIGLIDAPLHTLLAPGALPPIRWITPAERAGYWADPFGLPGAATELLCERYDERSGVGRIERLALHGDGTRSLGAVEVRDAGGAPGRLGGGLHASFPHTFEADGECFVVAETGAARECVLYRIDAQGRWHAPVTLLDNVAAADPALFRHDGRWWLAITDADQGVHDNLCLFHAEQLTGAWQPHAANPVKVDRGGARMAGRFFVHEGRLYRPGQDCSSTYGGAVVLFRVDELTPLRFRESPVRRLAPDPHGPLPSGLHHVSAWGERTLVDGKRLIVSPAALARKLRARWRTGSAA